MHHHIEIYHHYMFLLAVMIKNYTMGRLLAEVKAISQMVDLFPGKVEKCLL